MLQLNFSFSDAHITILYVFSGQRIQFHSLLIKISLLLCFGLKGRGLLLGRSDLLKESDLIRCKMKDFGKEKPIARLKMHLS